MQTGSAVIIHISPIIQQGLKNILLSRNIGIIDILPSLPECSTLSEWENLLILVDARYTDVLRKHQKILSKNRNTIIGIETNTAEYQPISYFDEMIFINDATELILQKFSTYISRVSNEKSNSQLSVREIEILSKIAQGLSNKLIADQLFLSIHTVITHRKNITSKLGIKSISGLTLYAALNNMVDSHS
jgi:DNA-binding CsgD family transcriptional regulator